MVAVLGTRSSRLPRRYHELVEEKGRKRAGDTSQATEGDTEPGLQIGDSDPSLEFDINFRERPDGFEIWYSDRIATDYRELVDQSADWLEDQLGVLNLGQVDSRLLVADGPLTGAVKDGLVAWWNERVGDLLLG